jgi:ribosomal protein S20
VNRFAEKALQSYEGEEMPAPKDSYSADLESEVKAFMSAVKSGDVRAAATALKEAVSLCK